MSRKKRVLVIGCGIAGPAVAILLKRAGCDPVIYEATSEHDDYAGLFLNVARNGLRILKDLGVDGSIRKEGFEMCIMNFRNGNGKQLGQAGRSILRRTPGITVKRGYLHKVLREEALRQKIPVMFGHKLADIQMTNDQVTAYFKNGISASGDFLIGCDGIHSSTRSLILPRAAKPLFTGLISFGGFTHSDAIPRKQGIQQMVFGKKAFFGYLVKESGEIYWFGNKEYQGTPTPDCSVFPEPWATQTCNQPSSGVFS